MDRRDVGHCEGVLSRFGMAGELGLLFPECLVLGVSLFCFLLFAFSPSFSCVQVLVTCFRSESPGPEEEHSYL